MQALDADLFASEPKPSGSKGAGVVDALLQAGIGDPMSLGTSRLCNDLKSPRPDTSMPVASLEWNRITLYYEPSPKPRDPLTQKFNTQNLTRGSFNGYMSPATRRKFKKHVSTWLRSIMLYRRHVKSRWDPGRAYPTMVTLTLPAQQVHTDAEINRACLQPWLQMMRRDHGVELYAWRAEAQENGNLHYHVILDRYIPKRAITGSWNMAIDVLDYRRRYWEETGSLTPPSTEVHALKDRIQDKQTGEWRDVDPVEYLVDYLMEIPVEEPAPAGEPQDPSKPKRMIGTYRKKDGTVGTYITRPITGRVWGMSDALREITAPKARLTPKMLEALEAAKDQGTVRRYDVDHASIYTGKISVALGRKDPGMWAVITDYYLQIFGWLYPGQLPDHYKRTHPPKDPRGLWVDLENYAFHYPPTLEERRDEWIEKHAPSDDLVCDFSRGRGYLRAKPELRWKSERIERKAARRGFTNILQRWHVHDAARASYS